MESNQSTEQLILEIAEELFLDKGFALTTTTEIAKRAGCNQAMVHYYFRTKENLFEKLFEKKFVLFTSALSVNPNDNSTLKEKIEYLIYKHLDVISENPKLPFLVINELTTNPTRFENILKKLKEQSILILSSLENELNKEIAAGRIRQVTAFDLVLNILSLNIFMFLAKPILVGIRNFSKEEYDEFVFKRRKEIFTTIWGGISLNH